MAFRLLTRRNGAILLFAALLFLLDAFRLINFHEAKLLDLRMRLRGKQPAHQDIVLVTIDDSSIRALGQWPWPRSIHAVLLDVLNRFHPKVIFYDVLFTEKSPDAAEDEKLAFAVGRTPHVIIPFYYYSEKPFEAFFPASPIREQVKESGYVNIEPDHDGKVRRVRVFLKTPAGQTYYHSSVSAVLSRFSNPDAAKRWAESLPVNSKGELWINYPGPIKSFQRVSFQEVITSVDTERHAEMEKLFAGRIVLVGDTATGSTDLRSTAFATLDPGVAIQGSAIHTLLTGRFLRFPPHLFNFVLLLLLAVTTTFLTQGLTPRRGLLTVLGLMAGYGTLNFLIFWITGWVLPITVPLIMMASLYGALIFRQYMSVRFQGELMARELTTAARIQHAFLPEIMPPADQLDVYYECRFAKQVGGDFCDWMDFGDGVFSLCLGDISGKGVPAAIFMAKAVSDLRRENQKGVLPAELMHKVNAIFSREPSAGMFLTLYFLLIDTRARKLWYANAGHEPMVFYSRREKMARLVEEPRGTPLGIFDESVYEEGQIPFEPGDMLLLISDGVRERRGAVGRQEYGTERLRHLLQEQAGSRSAKDLVAAVFAALQEHAKDVPPHDDQTLMAVRLPQ